MGPRLFHVNNVSYAGKNHPEVPPAKNTMTASRKEGNTFNLRKALFPTITHACLEKARETRSPAATPRFLQVEPHLRWIDVASTTLGPRRQRTHSVVCHPGANTTQPL